MKLWIKREFLSTLLSLLVATIDSANWEKGVFNLASAALLGPSFPASEFEHSRLLLLLLLFSNKCRSK